MVQQFRSGAGAFTVFAEGLLSAAAAVAVAGMSLQPVAELQRAAARQQLAAERPAGVAAASSAVAGAAGEPRAAAPPSRD
jgi:hypothetical protein